jgi:hypothetical protein
MTNRPLVVVAIALALAACHEDLTDPGSNPYAGGASAYGPVLRDLFEVTWLPATPILP